MSLFLIVTAVFSVAFAGMAIGVMFQGQDGVLKGSCGGPGANPDCCQKCDKEPGDRPPACEDAIEADLKRARLSGSRRSLDVAPPSAGQN